jgi:hypothetical protein
VKSTASGRVYSAGNAAEGQALRWWGVAEDQEGSGLAVVVPVVSLGMLLDLRVDHVQQATLIPVQNALAASNLLRICAVEAGFVPNCIDGRLGKDRCRLYAGTARGPRYCKLPIFTKAALVRRSDGGGGRVQVYSNAANCINRNFSKSNILRSSTRPTTIKNGRTAIIRPGIVGLFKFPQPDALPITRTHHNQSRRYNRYIRAWVNGKRQGEGLDLSLLIGMGIINRGRICGRIIERSIIRRRAEMKRKIIVSRWRWEMKRMIIIIMKEREGKMMSIYPILAMGGI